MRCMVVLLAVAWALWGFDRSASAQDGLGEQFVTSFRGFSATIQLGGDGMGFGSRNGPQLSSANRVAQSKQMLADEAKTQQQWLDSFVKGGHPFARWRQNVVTGKDARFQEGGTFSAHVRPQVAPVTARKVAEFGFIPGYNLFLHVSPEVPSVMAELVTLQYIALFTASGEVARPERGDYVAGIPSEFPSDMTWLLGNDNLFTLPSLALVAAVACARRDIATMRVAAKLPLASGCQWFDENLKSAFYGRIVARILTAIVDGQDFPPDVFAAIDQMPPEFAKGTALLLLGTMTDATWTRQSGLVLERMRARPAAFMVEKADLKDFIRPLLALAPQTAVVLPKPPPICAAAPHDPKFSKPAKGTGWTIWHEVIEAIEGRGGAVDACYATAWSQDPSSQSEVSVDYTVGIQGRVTDVEVYGATGKYAQCVADAVRDTPGLPKLGSPRQWHWHYALSARNQTPVAVEAAASGRSAAEAASRSKLTNDGSDRYEIEKIIDRKYSAIYRCYESALRDNPDSASTADATYTVGTAGTVTDCEIKGVHAALADCIKGKFMGIRGLPVLEKPRELKKHLIFHVETAKPNRER